MNNILNSVNIFLDSSPYAFALAGVAVVTLGGYVLEKVLFAWLRRFASKTVWEGDDVILKTIQGYIALFFMYGSVYYMLFRIPLTQEWFDRASTTVAVLAIVTATVMFSKLLVGLVRVYTHADDSKVPSASILNNIVRLAVYIVGLLIVLQTLGIAITPILTALGVGGLAVALALQDTLSNLFSGIHVLASRDVKPGDFIEIDSGEQGTVADISWRNTTMKNVNNQLIIVPNSKLSSAIVTNYNMSKRDVVVQLSVDVGYDSSLEKVEQVTMEIANALLKKFKAKKSSGNAEPTVRFTDFAESGITMLLTVRMKSGVNRFEFKHELIKQIHTRFTKEKIDLPYPTRTVYMKK